VYLRHTTISKDGKTHSYWRLVRSVRRGRKVVQETVAHLGELDGAGRARARRLALSITGKAEQYELFEASAGRASRSRCGRSGCGWNGRGSSAMSGSAGGCGARSSSMGSAPSG